MYLARRTHMRESHSDWPASSRVSATSVPQFWVSSIVSNTESNFRDRVKQPHRLDLKNGSSLWEVRVSLPETKSLVGSEFLVADLKRCGASRNTRSYLHPFKAA